MTEMNTALTPADDGDVARPLRVLVPLIQQELGHGDAAGLDHYRRAGEMLLEAKEQVGRSDWRGWVTRNFHLSYQTARTYMALASELRQPRPRVFTRLSDVIDTHRTTHQPAWHAPVQEAVNQIDTETFNRKREAMKRADELTVHRKLAQQLIDIGYKVLARKLHPDAGGSRDAMARLNAVRAALRHFVKGAHRL